MPHTARLSAAKRVFCIPCNRICSAIPSTSRSHTAAVASGVTSRGATPSRPWSLPGEPSGTTRSVFPESRRARRPPRCAPPLKIAPLQRFRHRRTGEIHFFAARTRIADRQDRRRRLGVRWERSIRCRGGHLHPQSPRRAALRPAAAILPSAGPAYSASSFPATTCR
jgi:hypothetical protein